ncbi:MAG: hypothetical protein K8S22_15675 [Betaproteobacteria bacterium]|nr:hypothetical protein [Betaproteobacteria bacterium]
MGRISHIRWLMAVLLAAVCPYALADEPRLDCAPFPTPEFKLTWVAPDMLYNGLPMQVRRFDSGENMQAILAYYRREWKATEKRLGAIEYEVGDWKVIAVLRERCFYTVQVQRAATGSGATGLLGVSQLQDPGLARDAGKGFPMMSGSNVVNDISHRDPGKPGRTILLMNAYSPATNAEFYRRNLEGDGWRVIADHGMRMRGGNGEAYTLTLKRGLNETSMTISRSGEGSSVLVNMMDKP